jgi:hypothetical protein
MVQVGSRYLETKRRLEHLIRRGEIVPTEIENRLMEAHFACYFCGGRIKEETIWVIEEIFEKGSRNYYLDRKCYERMLGERN